MPIVHFLPEGRSIDVVAGTTIIQAARLAGLVLESPCNCVGTCAKCTVRLGPDSLKKIARNGIRSDQLHELEPQGVLSCQTEVLGDISVELPAPEQAETFQILNHGERCAVELDPCIRKIYSETAKETAVFSRDELLARETGDTRADYCGIVVDIGTTTLVVSLVDLTTGQEIAAASSLNPQCRHAQDVLSRIRFASSEAGLRIMQTELIAEINRLTGTLTEQAGLDARALYEMVLSGNTCMLHLAVGCNPASLGRYPFTPLVLGGAQQSAEQLGLKIAAAGLVYLPPIISAYVGADITSGILATGLHKRNGVTLLVDIGTNGEMVLAGNGKMRATSTAAGPAFEGMNISCGMRASKGAVELFSISEDGEVTLKTIGDSRAKGLCGSGLLDVVGELVAHGVIGQNGRLVEAQTSTLPSALRQRLVKLGGKPVFQVTEDLYLTQKDIRQVQLAKGAVRAGIEFLLQDSGIAAGEVSRVLISGSFGYHLREKSLLNLGLLPAEFAGKVDFVGNTSMSGGQAFALNVGVRAEMADLAKQVEVIELANLPAFDRVFVRCLGF
jgi:uncharacterized 2Fe-2S/4Fe-4S cluster protein (DUF4445 family)